MTSTVARDCYAEELRVVSNLRSPQLVEALARVPRERFLGPGPWLLRGDGDNVPRRTESADPALVHHNVAVAIDPARDLYNGQPSLLTSWLDRLAIAPGDRFLHIGCGTGYYTALAAQMTGPSGRVFAIDVDEDLAARARANLADWPWVQAAAGDGRTSLPSDLNALLVNAGASHVLDEWLDVMADGGRLLVPLTTATSMPTMPATIGKGVALLLTRSGSEWAARVGSLVAIYSLVGARDDAMSLKVGKALMSGRWGAVTRLRRDAHDEGPACWLHGPTSCLSTA